MVGKINILLADDDLDFLELRQEFLESKGYKIITSNSPAEAKEILEKHNIHLAIIDLRLSGGDEMDFSGLLLAQNNARNIPKLILTNYPTYQVATEALRLDGYELPPAVDFLFKRETDLQKLAEVVEEVINRYILINWELDLQWQPLLSAPQIVPLIESGIDLKILPEYSIELEELFRKLFYDSKQVNIDSILFFTYRRVILKIYTYKSDGNGEDYLVSCGYSNIVKDEIANYQSLFPVDLKNKGFSFQKIVETPHFAAASYRFDAGDLEDVVSLETVCRSGNLTEVSMSLDNLIESNLKSWYYKGRPFQEEKRITDYYFDRLGKVKDLSRWPEQITKLCKELLAAGIGHCDLYTSNLTWRFPTGSIIVTPNPANWLKELKIEELSVQWSYTHGNLGVDTVLVGPGYKTCLIDFSQLRKAPLIHDFATLETSLKYTLMAKNDLATRYLLEADLLKIPSFDDEVVEASRFDEMANILPLISKIRQSAVEIINCDLFSYQLALFFIAITDIFKYQPDQHNNKQSLRRYGHALLSASIIYESLMIGVGVASKENHLPQFAQQSLWVDQENKVVWVEGRQIDLTIQEFEILFFLYKNANQLCDRQSIVEIGLGENYDTSFGQDESRLNSAMSRLRQKIEPDPGQLKYLLTVRGRGYKLQLPEN